MSSFCSQESLNDATNMAWHWQWHGMTYHFVSYQGMSSFSCFEESLNVSYNYSIMSCHRSALRRVSTCHIITVSCHVIVLLSGESQRCNEYVMALAMAWRDISFRIISRDVIGCEKSLPLGCTPEGALPNHQGWMAKHGANIFL